MTLDDLRNQLPDWAADQRLNISTVLQQPELTPVQAWGAAVACGVAARHPQLLATLRAEAASRLSPEQLDAAMGAASIMAMNNVYYRFNHMIEDEEYSRMPARLRMQIIAKQQAEKLDFELWCLAVSSINGCGACVVSHEKVAREKGASKAVIQAVVKIAAVVQATAVSLQAAAV